MINIRLRVKLANLALSYFRKLQHCL